MKVYRLTMAFFDGDHDHGQWESPLFATRADAEAFQAALVALPENEARRWGSCSLVGQDPGPEDAVIEEVNVCEQWDGVIPPERSMLRVIYT